MRKSYLWLLGTTTAITLTTLPAAAAADHFYGGFEFGLTHSPSSSLERNSDDLRLEVQRELGPVGGLYFGKKVGSRRFEIEYLLRSNNFKSLEVTDPGTSGLSGKSLADGTQKKYNLMVNGWQTLLGNETDWSLLAGVGVGLSQVKISGLKTDTVSFANTSKWVPAVQAMVQIVKPFGQGLEMGVGYRYMHNFNEDFASKAFEYKSFNHEVFARISWRFGGEEPSTPAPEPVMAPAPKPEPKPAVQVAPPAPAVAVKEVVKPIERPRPKPFIVYFDFDKSDITATAAQIINNAAKAYREFNAVQIDTVGHTDRAGSNQYNDALALRRAEIVKAALVSEGVPAHKIMIENKGETKPDVTTGDGVREEKNRRVEIKLIY